METVSPRGATQRTARHVDKSSAGRYMEPMKTLLIPLADVLAAPRIPRDSGRILGPSRDERPVRGFRFGSGPLAVSLLGGCHADEPVGPRLLRHLVSYLSELDEDDPVLTTYQWWIIPHINPDGERRNAVWADDDAAAYDLGRYLEGVVRELPGDDIEFGFPRAEDDARARPENRAAFDWWRTCDRPFVLHVSLHGTRFIAGPWFLIEEAWSDRCEPLKRACAERVAELGYVLHDVERHGEKGFVRLERGFHTRPDSRLMIRHFEELGDLETAGRFRPSSMETIRALGHDTLTLVPEMPLFITPGVGETLGPPDPVAAQWQERVSGWTADLQATGDRRAITEAGAEAGILSMSVRDQMDLQWTFILAGLELATGQGSAD